MKLLYFVILIFLSCNENPIHKGKKSSELNIDYVFTRNISSNSAEIVWSCSDKAEGFISYGISGTETILKTPFINRFHFIKLNTLQDGTRYRFQVSCRIKETKTSVLKYYRFETFTTITLPPPIITNSVIQRSIWILGGIGTDGNPVSQVDVFDPVEYKWYPNITSIPTPRAYSGIVSHKGKIYVIGGMTSSMGSYTTSNIVEELTIGENSFTWKTLNNVPTSIGGALTTSVGESIYLVGGAITTSVSSAIPNIIYRFSPFVGTSGTWTTITTLSSLPARVDLSGCSVDGNIFFNTGRDTSGNKQFTSDVYLPATNSTTSITEASFSQDRFGASGSCYRPKSTDPFLNDTPAMFIIGGSNNNNTSSPPTFIISSNRFEIYNTPSGTNTVSSGPNLPDFLYAPASEISYDKRRLYVFGGATTVNIPRTIVYSLDLSNPTTGPWNTETTVLPVPRYGHTAVILNR